MARADELNDLLWAYAAGCLERGDARAVEQAAAARPGVAARLGVIQRRLASSAPHREIVPLGFSPAARASVLDAPTLGAPSRRVGDRLVLRVEPRGPPEAHFPLLLREVAGVRERLYPEHPDDWAPLSAFRRDGAAVLLDLVLGPPAGRQEFTLLLVPAERVRADPSRAQEPGDALREVIAGEQPGWNIQVDVVSS